MPRRRNPECVRCAAQSVEVAQAKSCWNGQACHSKRSYYSNHALNKAKKRTRQRRQRIQSLDIPLFGYDLPPEVSMVLYRDRADGPIHAIEFIVVEDGQTLSRVTPIHLNGVPQTKLRSHIRNVISLLKAQFGQNIRISQSRQPTSLCPLCLQTEDEAHA
ncbi:hypothetical protein [Synechococcus sp. PCC 7335]|uniref:hypothetical protein n=1 Tax=Synechococcus sp. (strain ATCC 29403 / PCC 7335) TaxID=91464 RepID=UPI001D0D3944|nr:hypothetical protein [Synechococcus sp. PCC 7335]